MYKKGFAGFFVFGLVTLVVSLLVVATISMVNGLSQAPEQNFNPSIRKISLTNYFINSPDCFAYTNPKTQSIQPNTLDLNSYNQERLNQCYLAEDKTIPAYRLILSIDGEEDNIIKTSNWYGSGKITARRYIAIYDEGEFKEGSLFFEVKDES